MADWNSLRIVVAALLLQGVGVAAQQQEMVPGHAPELAVHALVSGTMAQLTVTTPSFANGTEIPHESTQYGGNLFPGLQWTAGPPGTRSYAVIVQGQRVNDAHAVTSIHLTVFDVPAGVTHLDKGLAPPPASAVLGPNVHGLHQAYVGPHAHPDAVNGYHFQVLALDETIPVSDTMQYDALIAAMRGHVLATGDVVGIASYDPTTPDATTTLPGPVKVSTGMLQGTPGRNPAITVFKGVPYAGAPVGDRRFREPQVPAAWTGVYKADHFSKLCPQMGDSATMSEDCLYANVWTGAHAATEKRPVFVWIYGGGFSMGTGSDPIFDGEALAAKGVIVVTFNYRIGVLGFLATPELTGESGHNASGNFGLLDDVAMLKWVQQNIAAFGGDPAHVTIGGQSAGAGSVGFMAMSPLAHGLFEQAIEESHARYSHDTELRYLSVSYRTLKDAETAGEKYAASVNAKSLKELRALPWQALLLPRDASDTSVETGSDAKPPLFRPVVDGWVLPANYSQTYANGTQNKVAVIAGNNRDETGAVPEFTFAQRRASGNKPTPGNPHINVTLAEFQAAAKHKFGSLAEEYLKLYPATNDDEAARQSSASARDNSRISTYLWALDWRQHCDKPLYTYFWTHRPTGDPAGAHHASEILFVFDNLGMKKQEWTDEDRKVAATVSSFWVNYISHGDPNGPGLPQWRGFDPKANTVMEFGDHFAPMPIASEAHIAFWRKFFATQPAW